MLPLLCTALLLARGQLQCFSQGCSLHSRRAVALGAALTGLAEPAQGAPFEWSFLYSSDSGGVPQTKRVGASPAEVAAVLSEDLKRGKYILTGNLSPDIFSDSCRFVDPNNAVDGLARYCQALSLLFDPSESTLEVNDVHVGSDSTTIEVDYVASGTLKLPWRPRIEPWSGHITYALGKDGLIQSQVDVWNITRFDAIRQTFTPR
eukprot:TRINITY_DN83584_c0_g1_i1.p1 TRINITY_DN83584_c0_g1~~TRINITY_DN83584_c0_g1_i1.p1  ORF type:complete len:216 (-),score=34.77 TRINITY_DN83584_c0_g1_i1:131-745(-)